MPSLSWTLLSFVAPRGKAADLVLWNRPLLKYDGQILSVELLSAEF